MRILLISTSDYLLGLFKGYCLNARSCEVNAIDNCNDFHSEINNNPPLLVFIDMAQIPQLLDTTEWQKSQRVIKENHIIICGIGKQPINNKDTQSKLRLKKTFPEPFNEDEILTFLYEILAGNNVSINDRRNGQRRNRVERRTPLTLMHTSHPPVTPPNEQHNSKENIRIGSLLINHSHQLITINNTPIDLSLKEFKIFNYLAENSGSAVKAEDIIKIAWTGYTRATKADVHQYIHMLRKKIEVDPHNPKILITIKGVGYELCP